MKKIFARIFVTSIAALGFSYVMFAMRLDEKLIIFIEPHFRKLTGNL